MNPIVGASPDRCDSHVRTDFGRFEHVTDTIDRAEVVGDVPRVADDVTRLRPVPGGSRRRRLALRPGWWDAGDAGLA